MHSTSEGDNEEKTILQSYMAEPTDDKSSFSAMTKFYCCPFDVRYEDLGEVGSATFFKAIFRDSMAGLVVAMVAIPMAMGFAIASGLQPGQGIVGGAIAGLLGALLGGSKYQVYGPSAAFIPVMNDIMALNMEGGPLYVEGTDDDEIFRRGHGLLVLISLVTAVMFLSLGLARIGTLVSKVPQCIVVGFTIGIAVTMVFALVEDALGIEKSGSLGQRHNGFWPKLVHVSDHIGDMNVYALAIAVGTLALSKGLAHVSVLIPGALLAIILSTLLAETAWSEKHLKNILDNYGPIPQNITITPPEFHIGDGDEFVPITIGKVLYYSMEIIIIGVVESLLCARMADNLAENKGTPFHPNKELWAQGWVNALVPLLNGFPLTGALSRTAMNVKLGAVTPFAGIMKCFLKLGIAFTCAGWLELMPMAAIAGLLWYVAVDMVSPTEIAQIHSQGGWPHSCVMCITAILVVSTDFLKGCASGMIIYAIGFLMAPDVFGEAGTKEEKAPILKKQASP